MKTFITVGSDKIKPAAGNAESVYSPDNSLLQNETCGKSGVSPAVQEQNPNDSGYDVKHEAHKPPRCSNCGTVLREGLVFCPGCGHKLK